MELSAEWAEYFSVLQALAERVAEPAERPNSLERECQVLSLLTRLEVLSETLAEDSAPAASPLTMTVTAKQLSRHLAVTKAVVDTLLRRPDHPNALPLLCLLANPQ